MQLDPYSISSKFGSKFQKLEKKCWLVIHHTKYHIGDCRGVWLAFDRNDSTISPLFLLGLGFKQYKSLINAQFFSYMISSPGYCRRDEPNNFITIGPSGGGDLGQDFESKKFQLKALFIIYELLFWRGWPAFDENSRWKGRILRSFW